MTILVRQCWYEHRVFKVNLDLLSHIIKAAGDVQVILVEIMKT